MTLRRNTSAIFLPLVVDAATVTPAARGPAAAPPWTGCSTGYIVLSVRTVTAEGFRVPAFMDSKTSGMPSSGRSRHGVGSVCGIRVSSQLTSFGRPVYTFIDNGRPAS